MSIIKKIKTTLLFVGCLLLLLFTANCSNYQKDYIYIPPGTEEARECILACKAARQDCNNIASKSYQECLREADRTSMLNYNIDLNTRETSLNTKRNLTLEECRHFSQQCQASYNKCYAECGGKVEPNFYSNVSGY
jgi:hypothetical protein